MIYKKLILALIAMVIINYKLNACTKFIYKGDNNLVLTARSTDWAGEVSTNLWAFPRGIERDGLAGKRSIKWTSKYGSVVASVHDMMTIDGMNEKGLTMSILRLKESVFIPKDKIGRRKRLSITLWGQYILDNFATVEEAVKEMEKDNIYIMPLTVANNESSGMHLVITDANGDFAVFEYSDGKLHIYYDDNYNIATNSPIYSKQLAINDYWKNIGGENFLTGRSNSTDRFVRGSYYLDKLPKTSDVNLATSYALSLLRNLSSPLGIHNGDNQEESATLWRTISDNTNKTYYYESVYHIYGFIIDLKSINFNKEESIKKIDLLAGNYYFGNATNRFVESTPLKFFPAVKELVNVK